VLRHQLIVLRRRVRGRAEPTNHDRWFFVQLYRWFPSILPVVMIICHKRTTCSAKKYLGAHQVAPRQSDTG
jgi:hypothetical protein